MDATPILETKAQIPDSFYTILGIIILTNLGTIITVIGAAFRIVYKFAVLETQTKALHRRLDHLEKKRRNAEEDEDTD